MVCALASDALPPATLYSSPPRTISVLCRANTSLSGRLPEPIQGCERSICRPVQPCDWLASRISLSERSTS